VHAAIFQSVAVSDLEPGWVGSEVILRQFVEIARSSALSEMASAIAHEINQPLGAIATFSQAGDRLLNRADPMVGRALEVFREINSEALAAGDGIRRIRKLLESATPERSLGRIPPVIEELRPVLEMMANSANIPFSVMVETPSPDLLLDKRRIQHVIFALVQNALDACAVVKPVIRTEPSRIELSARSDRYAVEISVTDSGCGIDEDVRRQLFRPFFTTKSKGTGLGLASSRAIVEAHEGAMGFEECATGGCRFWLRLPILPS
jgi:two-component system sensor kinase FixL